MSDAFRSPASSSDDSPLAVRPASTLVTSEPTAQELLAYCDEQLAGPLAAVIEQALRDDPQLVNRLSELLRARDQGGMTLGEIWRRQQISCPAEPMWRAFVRGGLSSSLADYLQFHLDTIGCGRCRAVVIAIREQAIGEEESITRSRHERFLKTSIGRGSAAMQE